MAEIVYVTETVKLPKEANEVRFFIIELLKDIRAKKTVAQISEENLANLWTAVQGFDVLDDECKDPAIYKLGALTGADMIEVFTAKKATV